MRNRNPLLRDSSSPFIQTSTRPIFALGDRMQDTIMEDQQENEEFDDIEDSEVERNAR